MLTTIFRVRCGEHSLKNVLRPHGLEWGNIQEKGDAGRRGRVLADYSASLCVSDDERKEAPWREMERFLEQHQGVFADLRALGAEMEIDVGFSVYARRPGGFRMSSKILNLLGENSISLEASGYPCADDDGDAEKPSL